MPATVRLIYIGSPDLHDLLMGAPQGGRKLDEGLAVAIAPSTHLQIAEVDSSGWAKSLQLLRSEGLGNSKDIDLLLTSVSSEIADPSPEPRESLSELARLLQEKYRGHVVVLNGSSVVPRPAGASSAISEGDEPLDMRIRRLNLSVMEASHATGLSVIDADQVVAELSVPGKVIGPFDYSPEVNKALQSRLVSILDELGFAERPVMEARVPFVRQARELTVQKWFKSEGDHVAADDLMCELRVASFRKMTRPTTAIMLSSIEGRPPLVRRLLNREREQQPAWDVVLSLVARESGVLRKILQPAGVAVGLGDALALLTRQLETPIEGSSRRDTYRAVLRTQDPRLENLL